MCATVTLILWLLVFAGVVLVFAALAAVAEDFKIWAVSLLSGGVLCLLAIAALHDLGVVYLGKMCATSCIG